MIAPHRPTRPRRTGHILGRVVLLCGLLLLLVVVPAWLMFGPASPQSARAAEDTPQGKAGADGYVVERINFDQIVTASGELEARNQLELKSEVEGQTTIVQLLDEGTEVKKGDVIVKLADDEIRNKIEQEDLNVEQALADKVSAEENMVITRSEADSDLKAAKVKLELAELDKAKWEKGDAVKQRRDLDLKLETSQRNLVRAKRDLEASKQLYDERFISLSEYEDDQITLIEAENTLASAKLDIEVFEKYTLPKERSKFASDVEQASAGYERTKRKNDSKIAQAEANLRGKVRALKIREDRLAKLREQLEATEIKAPQDGLVVYATSSGRQRWQEPIRQGRQVRFNESLILLPDTTQMVASVKVHEALVDQVKADQTASVTVDAKNQAPMTGKVYQIGVMAQDGGWFNPDLREYEVKIELPTSESTELKPAMRCKARIVTGRVTDALAVPLQAVFAEGRDRICYVRTSGHMVRKQKVKLGRASETYVEITEGLNEGDVVLVSKPETRFIEK